jgi:hypothetical protein
LITQKKLKMDRIEGMSEMTLNESKTIGGGRIAIENWISALVRYFDVAPNAGSVDWSSAARIN